MGNLIDSIETKNSSILKDISTPEKTDTPLSFQEQSYANEIATDLEGSEALPIATGNDWVNLNKRESLKMLLEDSNAFVQNSFRSIAEGLGDINTVSQEAQNMAVEDSIANSDEGIPHAAAISRTRKDLAEALINNEENQALPREIQKRQQTYEEKRAVLESAYKMSMYDASKATTGQKFSYFANQVAPLPYVAGGISAWSYKDALEAIGMKDVGVNPVENQRLFLGVVSKVFRDESISTLQFSDYVDRLKQRMYEGGVNPLEVAGLFEAAIDFSPEKETFYKVADVAALAGSAVKGAAGVAKAASFTEAAKAIAGAGVEYVNVIPGLDGKLVKTTNKILDKTVRPVEDVVNKIGRAVRQGDREKAIEMTVDALGAPIDTSRPFYRANKQDAYHFANDSFVKPDAPSDVITANETAVVSEKVSKETQAAIETAINRTDMLRELKKESYVHAAEDVIDTLKMNDIIGAGKGVGIGDIISAFDKGNLREVQETGNVVASVRLKANFPARPVYKVDDAGNATEIIEKDVGFERAYNLGKSMSKTMGDVKTTFSVEKTAGSNRWLVNLQVDFGKGWGTMHYDLVNGSKEKLEKFRPFLSSMATVTSNPKDIQELNTARILTAQPLTSTGDSAIRSYKALSKKDKQLMNDIADTELRYNAWYTSEVLRDRGVPESVIKVNEQYRAMNDIDYFVRNKVTLEDLERLGAKNYSFNGEFMKGVGREVPVSSPEDFIKTLQGKEAGKAHRDLLIDKLTGEKQNPLMMSEPELKQMFLKGYKIIEGSLSPEEGMAAKSIYYVLNPNGLVENKLGQFVTTYLAGGRRFFDRSAGFVKQLRIDTMSTGRKGIVGVNTFATDMDYYGLTKRTDVVERVRKEICNGNDLKATEIIQNELAKAPFRNAQEFRDFWSARGMDLENVDNALEVVHNGKMLSSYEKLANAETMDDFVGFNDMYNLQHRSHFQAISNEAKEAKLRRTGKELLTYDFEAAQPVDIEQQMRYMVDDMVYTGVMNEFSSFYAERFSKLFGKVMESPRSGIAPTPIEMLMYRNVKSGLDGASADLARQAETAKNNYMAIRGIPTKFDRMISDSTSAMFRWVGGVAQDVLKLSDERAHGIRTMWQKLIAKDPLGYARSFTSHWYLGCFNISQLYKQMSADAFVFMLEPAAAAQATKYVLPFASALRKSDGNLMKAMDALALKFGDAPESVRIDFENLINMGVFEHGVAGGFLEKGATVSSKLSKLSMAPFNWGEMNNRVLSFYTAAIAKGFKGKKMSPAELIDVATYGQKLFLNMDASGLARIQTSTLGKTLFQFMGFRMRWLETILFDKALTKQQRTRLALGTAVLAGGEGMLGVAAWNGITNVFNGFTDSNTPAFDERNEFTRFIARGLPNYISEMSGVDVDVGLWDLGLVDAADAITGIAQMDFPVVTAGGKAIESFMHLGKALNKAVFGEETYEDFKGRLEIMARAGEFPSSTRPILGYMFWQSGKKFNSKGQLTEVSNSHLRHVLDMLGFNSLELRDRIKAYNEYSSVENLKKEIITEAQPLLTMAYREPHPEYIAAVSQMIKGVGNIQLQAEITKELNEYCLKNLDTPLATVLLNNQMVSGGVHGNSLIQKERTK